MLPATAEVKEKEHRVHERFRAEFLATKQMFIDEESAATDRPRLVKKIAH
jgi:hypothetical protein